jgi:hypothetical protein
VPRPTRIAFIIGWLGTLISILGIGFFEATRPQASPPPGKGAAGEGGLSPLGYVLVAVELGVLWFLNTKIVNHSQGMGVPNFRLNTRDLAGLSLLRPAVFSVLF